MAYRRGTRPNWTKMLCVRKPSLRQRAPATVATIPARVRPISNLPRLTGLHSRPDITGSAYNFPYATGT